MAARRRRAGGRGRERAQATQRRETVVGYHAVSAAIASGRAQRLALLDAKNDQRGRALREQAAKADLRIDFVDRHALGELAGGVVHNGCAALVAPIIFHGLDDFLEARRLLLLDDCEDPHNLGACLRIAAAFGIDGVLIAGHSPPPLGAVVAKAAAGHLETVAIAKVSVAGDALTRLRDRGFWSYGAAADGAALTAGAAPEPWVLAIGSEGRGLRAKTRAAIDEGVSIPMSKGVESLNLSVACGILCAALGGVLKGSGKS